MNLFPNFDNVLFLTQKHEGWQGRLFSLFVGITAPLFNLPLMVWYFMLKPVLVGFSIIVQFWFQSWVYGIAGYVSSIDREGRVLMSAGLSKKRR